MGLVTAVTQIPSLAVTTWRVPLMEGKEKKKKKKRNENERREGEYR